MDGSARPDRFARIPEPVLRDARLSSNAVRVYGVLVRHANTKGECWPGLGRIAEWAHLSARHVQRALAELRDAGHIAIVRRGRRLTNSYKVTGQPCRITGEVIGHGRQGDRTPVSSGDRTPVSREGEPVEREPLNDARASAKAVLDSWWQEQTPRPQQPYPAALKVLIKAVRSGWTPSDLRSALDEIPTVSGGALDYWRRRRSNGQRPGRSPATVEGASGVVRRIMGGDP